MHQGQLTYLPPTQLFLKPQDWSKQELVLKIKVPHPKLVGWVAVKDDQGHSQRTRWTEGQSDRHNFNYDAANQILTLRYRPSPEEVDLQGHTDAGFDPSRIRQIQVGVSNNGSQDSLVGSLQILSQELQPSQAASQAAQVRPLYGKNSGPSGEDWQGVSRYFVYGDLQRWPEARPKVEETFARQQAAGLRAFRNMGGLDLRQGTVSPEAHQAMREYLQLAEKYGQDQHIFTLLDGAIPNARLQRAFEDPQEAHKLVQELRPFIREFGQAKIKEQPVVFDLVNEIHGTPGSESSKQALVEQLVNVFVEEAPGARLTVGVQNFRELRFWNYLNEKYAQAPVHFDLSFHLYEPIQNLPERSQLNVPDGVRVLITEADPKVGMQEQIQIARQKGYDGLLFWEDANHPYRP
jgi:hypothetical protein